MQSFRRQSDCFALWRPAGPAGLDCSVLLLRDVDSHPDWFASVALAEHWLRDGSGWLDSVGSAAAPGRVPVRFTINADAYGPSDINEGVEERIAALIYMR